MASEVVAAGQCLCIFWPVAVVHRSRRSSVVEKSNSSCGGNARERQGGAGVSNSPSDLTFSYRACLTGWSTTSWQNLRVRTKETRAFEEH